MNGFSEYIRNMRIRQVVVIFLLIILFLALVQKLMFMLSAFLGAFVLYILFRRAHKVIVRRYKWKKSYATLFLSTISLIIVSIPLYFIIDFLVKKLQPYVNDPSPITKSIESMNDYINQYVEFSFISPSTISKISGMAQTVIPMILDSGFNLLTNLIMMYFILWFMLNKSFEMERWIKRNSIFTRKQTQHIFNNIKSSVVSNSIGIVILGLIQGITAIIGYFIFGASEPIFWGLITGAASVVPFVGTMLVWTPISILMMANGNVSEGIGLALYGLFIIGGSDNVFRFILQKKLASTHPLITVLGVIGGLSLMGFWGLIYGPLMITLFIILGRIYKEDFMQVNTHH